MLTQMCQPRVGRGRDSTDCSVWHVGVWCALIVVRAGRAIGRGFGRRYLRRDRRCCSGSQCSYRSCFFYNQEHHWCRSICNALSAQYLRHWHLAWSADSFGRCCGICVVVHTTWGRIRQRQPRHTHHRAALGGYDWPRCMDHRCHYVSSWFRLSHPVHGYVHASGLGFCASAFVRRADSDDRRPSAATLPR